jgi:hypothetical protein
MGNNAPAVPREISRNIFSVKGKRLVPKYPDSKKAANRARPSMMKVRANIFLLEYSIYSGIPFPSN